MFNMIPPATNMQINKKPKKQQVGYGVNKREVH